MEGFTNVQVIDLAEDGQHANGYRKELAVLRLDPWVKAFLMNLATSQPPPRAVPFADLVSCDRRNFWKQSAKERVKVPVAISDAGEMLGLSLGFTTDGRPVIHGAVAGATGAGKSSFYHTLILALCILHSPEEVQLYLVDGKCGVEFGVYRRLPHARVVVLNSEAEYARKLLSEVIDEMERRNAMFARAGVVDFIQYRAAGQRSGSLPRLLIIIDEYQQLFEGDKEGVASKLLLRIVQQGRNAGIHLLLGSQRFGAVGMLHQTAIFGNIHLRIAMKMALSDRLSLTEFGPDGRRLIGQCDRPGRIVINAQAGDDGANEIGQAAFIDAQSCRAVVTELRKQADADLPSGKDLQPIVIDGKEAPDLTEHPLVARLLQQGRRLAAPEFETLARMPVCEGGLGLGQFCQAERPGVLIVGCPFDIRGHVHVMVQRGASEHVCMVGGAHPARVAMMASMAVSLALVPQPDAVAMHLCDFSPPGSSWHDVLRQVGEDVLSSAKVERTFTRVASEVAGLIERLYAEFERRQGLPTQKCALQPSLFLFIADVERMSALHRQPGKLGVLTDSSLGSKLKAVCCDGPALGMHCVFSCASCAGLNQLFDRNAVERFKHRIALQMSEDDSHWMIKSRLAARLQDHGPTPICAQYANPAEGVSVRFKPFSTESGRSFAGQLSQISRAFQQRKPI